MEIKIAIWVLATILSAVFYRAGGQGKEETERPKWIPKWLRRSWVRDWLCPLFVYGSLCLFLLPLHLLQWIPFVISYGLLGGALTTYLDSIFGYDNFWASGFLCGLSSIPLVFCGISIWLILIRSIVLAIGWGLWCKYQSIDYIEEMGRGSLLVLTTPILLI